MARMLILVNGATVAVARHPAVGRLLSPRAGNAIADDRPWAADNDAFGAWDADRYWRMLGRIARADRTRLLWIAAPDVVGDAQATVNRWVEWYPRLDHLGLPAAFVGQDGLGVIAEQVPWDEMACFFIGGSTDWKLSEEAEGFAVEAKARGKWVHMGRCNTARRIRHAVEIGCDSIDGRKFVLAPDVEIPRGLRRIRDVMQQQHFLTHRLPIVLVGGATAPGLVASG